jgi:hypothetical protein
MSTATDTNNTFTDVQIDAGRSIPAIRCIDDNLAAAARVFFDAAMRTLTPQIHTESTTYQRLAQHEERFAETADAAGRSEAAALARRCAALLATGPTPSPCSPNCPWAPLWPPESLVTSIED